MSAAMQKARDVIAEALLDTGAAWSEGSAQYAADAILAALVERMGLREVLATDYDGESSMSDKPHRKQAGHDLTRERVEITWGLGVLLSNVLGRRIEARLVTDWQED